MLRALSGPVKEVVSKQGEQPNIVGCCYLKLVVVSCCASSRSLFARFFVSTTGLEPSEKTTQNGVYKMFHHKCGSDGVK